jgi:conjugal transfer pilus assembly protein TraB
MGFLSNLSVKQKQRAKVFITAGIFIIAIALFFSVTGKQEKKVKEETQRPRKFSVLTEKVEKDLWIAAEGENIKALQKSVEDLQNEVGKFREELEKIKKKQESEGTVKKIVPPVPVPPPSPTTTPAPPHSGTVHSPSRPPEKTQPSSREEKRVRGILLFEEERKPDRKETGKIKKEEESFIWIPTGSVTKAVLLSGIDVPTSLSAKSEPYPVLLMLSDLSLIPNDFKMNLKGCFVVGSGFGNIVEERAYIRTETLSCVKRDGTPWEVPLKAQVVGEDGKLGMRGKIVSKQGRQIALSIVTGILSGLGQSLSPRAPIQFVETKREEGKYTLLTPNVGEALEAAGLTGVGSALSRVADYYLKLAEQMYPVIEIEAGREVEIFVVKGGRLSPQEKPKGGTS